MNITRTGRLSLLATTILLFLATAGSSAQSRLFVNASQQITNFRYVNSEAVLDKNYNPEYSGAYSVGYAYEFDFGLFLRANTGMRKSGATMVYDAANYRWDFQYLHNTIGAGYQLNIGIFAPYLSVSGYYGYLLKANQRVNNEDFDIIDSESIIRHDAGIIFSAGLNVNVSETLRVYGEVGYLRGLQNIEAESQARTTFSYLLATRNLATDITDQVTTNVAVVFTVGLSFALN